MASEIQLNLMLTVTNPSTGGGFYDQEMPGQLSVTQNALGMESGVISIAAAGGGTVLQGTAAKPSAAAATTAALAANTYSNGAAGVGATLTATANGALAAVDGVTLAVNQNVLVKNEVAAANNGLYTITQLGDGSHPYILTRVTSMDSSTKYVGAVIWVDGGATNGQQNWNCTNAAAPTVGTTAITFGASAAGTIISYGSVTTPGFAYLQNLDATNFITWGSTIGGALQPAGKIKAGENVIVRLSPGMVLRALADTAACNLKIKIFQD